MHNGSSLFPGDAGQGESNVRRWIIENDWLEEIRADILAVERGKTEGLLAEVVGKAALKVCYRQTDMWAPGCAVL